MKSSYGIAGYCPRCNTEVSRERHATGYAICECGWFDATPLVTANQKSEKKTVGALVAMAVVVTLAYGHLLNWGSYSLAIPVVKIQQLTGTLSKEGYSELAQACITLNKWSCAKDAYLAIYKKAGDVSGLADLALLETRLNDTGAALSTYAAYFQANKIEVGEAQGTAALRYAKLLEEAGRNDEAMKMYEVSIAARPEKLPVQATTAIVRLLMKQGKYADAHARVTAFHESAGNAKGYLNTELAQLESYIGSLPESKADKSKQKTKRRSA